MAKVFFKIGYEVFGRWIGDANVLDDMGVEKVALVECVVHYSRMHKVFQTPTRKAVIGGTSRMLPCVFCHPKVA